MTKSKKIVLHIVGSLDVGGVEKWLSNLINFSIKKDENIDFYFMSMHPTRNKIVKEINLTNDRFLFSYGVGLFFRVFSLIKTINAIKPDVVHTHPGYSSGIYSFICKFMGVKKVFVHSHSDRRKIDENVSFFKKKYIKLCKFLIEKFSDYKIAVSNGSALSLFNNNYEVNYCGINTDNSAQSYDELMEELKNDNKKIIFHIGRNNDAKNYPFIVEIAEGLTPHPDIFIICIGANLEGVKETCEIKGLKNIHFVGYKENPFSLFSNYGDLFIMPSKWEGLPLSAIEAQKAGLTSFLSDNITYETNIGLCEYLPLDKSIWVEAIIETLSNNSSGKDVSVINQDLFTIEDNYNFYKERYYDL